MKLIARIQIKLHAVTIVPTQKLTVFLRRVHGHEYSTKLSHEIVKLFPEMEIVSKSFQTGKLEQSIDSIERTYNIISNATGPQSEQSRSLLSLLVHTLYLCGQYPKLKSICLSKETHSLPLSHVENLLYLSLSELQQGELHESMELINRAINVCEDTATAIPNDYFSRCYGLKGLLHLNRGDYHDAESYLQLSARWSQSPLQDIIAFNNLGSLMYLSTNANSSSHFNPQQFEQDFMQLPISKYNNQINSVQSTDQLTSTRIARNNLSNLSSSDISRINSALDYWNEGILVAERKTAPISDAATSAMCGVPIVNEPKNIKPRIVDRSSDNNSSGSDSGAGEGVPNVLSPDGSVTFTSFTKTISTADGANDSHFSLDSVELAVLYSGLLCNIAEANNALGNLQAASDLLAKALKLLELHQESNPFICTPAFSRVLGLLGYQCMYSSQAVIAEGLFRSALDGYKRFPLVLKNDIRNQYEYAIISGRLGLLLSKWDKRESEGAALVSHANEILEKIKLLNRANYNIFTTSLLQFPNL